MSNTHLNCVFKAKFRLAMNDPDVPGPRHHTIIFVETHEQGPGGGIKHHVTGDVVNGMRYESIAIADPTQDENLHSKELIGYARLGTYPEAWNALLETLPAPPKQKAFNIATMKTEPVKSWDRLTFYDPGETRRPLVKCTEWVELQAVPSLIEHASLELVSADSMIPTARSS